MSSASSVLPSDLVSVEVAAQQVGPPSDLVDQVHVPCYPVPAPEGSQMATHAQRRNRPRSADLVDQVHVSGALSGACTGKGPRMANSRPRHAAAWRSRNRAPAGWVAWATNAITEGRARFRIGTQWFSRSGCWNRRASSRERAIAVESRIEKKTVEKPA